MIKQCGKVSILLFAIVGLLCGATSAVLASPASTQGQATIQSGCTIPPCGEIYNNTNRWWNIKRQDCTGCGWIEDSIAPWGHRGGFWNDGVDWDAFAVPYGCSMSVRLNGVSRGYRNISEAPHRWISFESNQTVEIYSYSC